VSAPYSTTLSDYTKAFTLAWQDSWGDLTWLILDQSPLLHYWYSTGAIHMSAARAAELPFAHDESPNVQTYSGTEVLNSADSEFVKPFIYDQWGQVSCQSVVPTDKVDLNADATTQIANMLDVEVQQCAITMRNFIETQLHSARVASTDIDGIRGALEFATPAAQAATATSVGNVAKNADYHFNQYGQIPGGFMANGIPAWTTLYRQCSRWGSRPDFMPVDEDVYDGYEEWCGPERALIDEAMGSAGFDHLRFKGARVVPDYNITANSGEGFMLNLAKKAPSSESGHGFKPEFLDPVKGKSVGRTSTGKTNLWINKNAHFYMDEWRMPPDQWALMSKCKFHAIIAWTDLREHGTFDFAAGNYVA